MSKTKIGLFGCGVVGQGVFELINQNSNKLNIEVSKVFDKESRREYLKDKLVTEIDPIINDKEISTVIECMGGDALPYQIITKALNAKKNVVTSNKETIALHYYEYLELAKKNNVTILFEASVGGGIPLLHPLIMDAKFDKAKSFKGILNGSTNFIITKMMNENMEFDEACKIARELGYLEANPDADLLGLDMLRKGVIVSNILFKTKVKLEDINNFGIKKLTLDIIDDIKKMDKSLKMVVSGYFKEDKFYLSVMPMLISKTDPLSNVNYAFNGVSIDFENNGLLTFNGLGAGRYPTAAAIMQDVTSILDSKVTIDFEGYKCVEVNIDLSGDYYIIKDNKKLIVNNPSLELLKEADFIAKMGE